jgi:hypothetical protein
LRSGLDLLTAADLLCSRDIRRRLVGLTSDSFVDRKPMPTHARPIHDRDRMFEVDRIRLSQDAIQQFQHLVVGVGAATKQDDSGGRRSLDCEKSREIEIRRHDDLCMRTSGSQNLGIPSACQTDTRSMNCIVAGIHEPVHGSGRDWHID